MLVIPHARRLKQEDGEFLASLDYKVRPDLENVSVSRGLNCRSDFIG